MVSKGAIDAGLSSHAQWKSRLLDAISRYLRRTRARIEQMERKTVTTIGTICSAL